MQLGYYVSFTDGSSDVFSIERQFGSHPDSPSAIKEVLDVAEKFGKTVKLISPHLSESAFMREEVLLLYEQTIA